jgi:hypothetical protein
MTTFTTRKVIKELAIIYYLAKVAAIVVVLKLDFPQFQTFLIFMKFFKRRTLKKKFSLSTRYNLSVNKNHTFIVFSIIPQVIIQLQISMFEKVLQIIV